MSSTYVDTDTLCEQVQHLLAERANWLRWNPIAPRKLVRREKWSPYVTKVARIKGTSLYCLGESKGGRLVGILKQDGTMCVKETASLTRGSLLQIIQTLG